MHRGSLVLPRLPFSRLFAGGLLLLCAAASSNAAEPLPADLVADFTDRHCSSCHNDVDREGGLDLTTLQYTPESPENFMLWVKVHDRVQSGEMPPKDKKRPAADELAGFVRALATSLTSAEKETLARDGRATRRRLNRNEYEYVLRDLLQAPWLQIKDQFPEDGEAFRFNKVSSALDVSYVHMSRYMSAADYAMRQVMSAQFTRPPTRTQRFYARDDGGLTNYYFGVFNPMPERVKYPVLDMHGQPEIRANREAPSSDPALKDREAVAWMSSNYVTGFGSTWSSFRAPVAGRYRLRFSGFTMWVGPGGAVHRFANGNDRVGEPGVPQWFRPNGDLLSPGRRYEPITVYARGGAMNRRLGEFDLFPEPTTAEVNDVWLVANEMIVTDATRFFRSRPVGGSNPGNFTNPLAQRDGAPAVAFRWMEVEGPLYDEPDHAGYRLLFGDLPMQKVEAGAPGVDIEVVQTQSGGRGRGGRGGRGGSIVGATRVEVVTENPRADAERLLRQFLDRSYRRPVAEKEVRRFLALIQQRQDAGLGFAASLLAGYTAVLASPEFVFLDEQPGRLDPRALATRLALFLWNSEPDAVLRQRAERGELTRPDVLRAETERMLADPRADRFVEAFLDYWLEIRRMEETTPSTTLYNDYYLDDSLTEAAVAETRLFFAEMLRRDLPARNIVDSDFTFLNDRLATHYGIEGVEGVAMRPVTLPADSMRGGFMTQASVLKVTANGTTTSPVLRGKWIMERVAGYDVPPPPAAVPAVEPDIRGAVTIRDQLEKHRADESCAACHRKIDPPGFALESFDVLGGWRERYRGTAIDAEPAKGMGKNGWPFAFYYAQPVDASGQLDDGRVFRDVRDFKQLLLEDEAQIARNFARQLSVFATGAPVRFSDRPAIEQIIQQTRDGGYGIRSILHALVQSELFRTK